MRMIGTWKTVGLTGSSYAGLGVSGSVKTTVGSVTRPDRKPPPVRVVVVVGVVVDVVVAPGRSVVGDHVQASILRAPCALRGAHGKIGRGTGISGDPLRGTRVPICPAASTRRRSTWDGAHPCPRLADRTNLPAPASVDHASKTEVAKQPWMLVVPKRRPQLYAPP